MCTQQTSDFNGVLAAMVDNFKKYVPRYYSVYLKFNSESEEFITLFADKINSDHIANKNASVFDDLNLNIRYQDLNGRSKSILWQYIAVLQAISENDVGS